jgi:hypothetical protein
MTNIAEALVATAVGILVAIPAVAAFNMFQRIVKTTAANTDALSHVLLAHLKATGPNAATLHRGGNTPQNRRVSDAPPPAKKRAPVEDSDKDEA